MIRPTWNPGRSNQSQERYYFRSYEDVETLYNQTKKFVTKRDEFLNE
jgi:hypothetical protein